MNTVQQFSEAINLEELLKEARAEGAEKMRALCAALDPYELHMEGAPYARTIGSPDSIIQIMQDGILALPNPYGKEQHD